MKLLVLLGLCALALAKIPSSSWEQEHYPEFNIQENVFRPGKEYRFKYEGQLASGIPQSSRQHSATRIQALVSLLFKQQDSVLLQIQQVRVGRLNRRIPNPRAMIPFMAFEEVDITQQLENKLKAPVKFSYTNGMISEVVFDGKEEAWSANIKRGILNMLQVNLQKAGRTDQSEEARLTNRVPNHTPELDFFSAMEPTLEGQCETLYTVTSQPSPRFSQGPVLNVTKSIDFEKCQKRPDIKYNWRFEDPCPTCQPKYAEDQKFLKASTIAKYNISGTVEEFCIESAIVESQYNFVPFNREGNMMTTYVNQTLVLIYSGEPQQRIQSPRNPQPSDSDLVFSPDWDIAKEALFMEGEEEFLRDTPYSELKNKKQFVKEILRRLISEMSESVQEEAPRQYLRLVKIMRMLKKSQLQELHEAFFLQPGPFTPEQHLKIKNILIDALADAATKDAVSHLVQKIKSKEISPIRAAVSIKSLINCRVVSQSMIEEMLSLAESPVCQKNWFLKQSVYLTLGSMVNALCQTNKDKLASEFKTRPQRFCPREFQQQLVEKMFSKYQNARNYGDKVVYMKTIANMGLDLSVFELEKIIKNVDGSENPQLRVEAVIALRQIKHTMPRKVQKICMPVFMNRQVPTEVRIACVYTLMQTIPSRPILDQIARKLHTERNRQVASFVYTYMTTMANSTNPCFQKMARDLQLSLRHGQKIGYAFYPAYSKFIHASANSRRYRMGLNVNIGSVMSQVSPIPRMMAVDISANSLGMWNNHLLSFGIAATDMESLLQKYLGNRGYWSEMDLEDVLIRTPRSSKTQQPKQILKQLWKKLKTVQRNLPNNPQGYIFLKFKDQDFGILPFNLQTMTESFSDFIQEGRINLREIERFLESGYNFHVYKAALLHELSYKVPTTIGMPLVLSVKVPTVMQLTGQIKAKITHRWQKAKVELVNTKPSMVSAVVADLQVWSPIANSGLKVVGLAKVFTPVEGEMEFDLTSSPAELIVKYRPPQESVQWLHLETRPITYTRVWPKFLKSWQEPQEKTIQGEEWNRQYNFENDFPIIKKFEEFCEESLGVKLFLQGQWHHTPAMRLSSTPFCPLSGPNKLYVRTQPTSQQPRVVITKLSGSIFSQQSSPLRFSESLESFLEQEEEQMEQQWQNYRSPHHFQSQINVEVFTKGGRQIRAELEAKVKCDKQLRLCKLETQAERSPIPQYDSQPFKMCVESEYLYPETPYSLSQLSGKKIVGQLKTTWGRSCQQQNFLKIRALAQRSRQQRQMLQQEPEYQYFSEESCQARPERCSPVQQYRSVVKASRLNSIKMEAEWQNLSPRVQNLTQKIYRAIKTALYWNSEVNNFQVENPSNKVQVRMSLDAQNQRYLNVTVKTPKEKAIFRDLPLPLPVRSPLSIKRAQDHISSVQTLWESMSQQAAPVCQAHSRHIQTFDGQRYSVPLSTCYSVLAKDCMQQNFAVLIRKIEQTSQQKKIKIVVPSHQITIEPQGQSSFKVVVNGEQMEISQEEPTVLRDHGHQVVSRIQKTGPYCKVQLPEAGVRVFFDGIAANIKISPLLQNIQCGLCGHYDNEPSDEWRNPEMEEEQDVRRFFQSFTLKEKQCSFPQEIEQICQTEECLSQEPNFEQEQQWQRSWESQSEEESSEEQEETYPRQSFRPVPRTKVMEQGGKICFSKSPVPRCPHHSYPSQHQSSPRKVAYTCLPRDDPEVQSLLNQVRSQRQTPSRVQSLPTTFQQPETQPQACRRL